MKWLFLVHQVRTVQSRERVKVWRLTKKVGALLYRNSVYILPYSKERLEDFQWLCQQIRDSQGEASVFISESTDQNENKSIASLFVQARDEEYHALLKTIDALRKRISHLQPGTLSAGSLNSIEKDRKSIIDGFAAVSKIDFFKNPLHTKVQVEMEHVQAELTLLRSSPTVQKKFPHRSIKEYKGKLWGTRPNIHIDRVCTAWLIRRFIDPKAKFVFASESRLPAHAIPFDIMGAEFGHHGESCTFETLLQSFRIKDKALQEIGEIVHDIDLKDQRFKRPEATGIDTILRSLSHSLRDDKKVLDAGSTILNALYESLGSKGGKQRGKR